MREALPEIAFLNSTTMKDFYNRFFKSLLGLLFVALFFLSTEKKAEAQCTITCPIATPENFTMQNGNVVSADTIVFPPFPPAICAALVSWPAPTVTGCGANTYTQLAGPVSGGTLNVGYYTVTYATTSGGGNPNEDTCSFTIAVLDTVSPKITGCPTDITVYQEPDTCGAHVTWVAPNASDACQLQSFVPNYNSGDFIPIVVGGETITYLATDTSGNTSKCEFVITVLDTSAPVITFCPNDTIVSTDAGLCTASITLPDLQYNEDCAATIAWSVTGAGAVPAAGSGVTVSATFNKGVSTVTYVVSDPSGNTTSCSVQVTVEDNEAPILVCTNGPNETFNTSDDGTGDCTYVYTDNVIYLENCDGDITYTVTHNGVAGPPTTYASNVSGGTATPTITLSAGTNVITWVMTDDAGNADICSHTVTIVDDEPPVFTSCPPNSTFPNTTDSCGAIVNYTITATDNCSLASVVQIAGLPSGSLFPVGTTTVTYLATDTAGNTSQCSFDVTVTDAQAPTPAGCTDQTFYVDGSCTALVEWTIPTATDNCPGPITINQFAGISYGSTQSPGTYPVSYSFTDGAGNVSFCTFNIIVLDTISPDFGATCPGDITAYADATCNAVVNWTVPTATDNCGISTFTATGPGTSTTMGGAESVNLAAGVYTQTYVATDAAGNSKKCEFTITVLDNIAPTISGTTTGPFNTDPGACTYTGSGLNFTVNDNCSNPINVQEIGVNAGDTVFNTNNNLAPGPYTQGARTYPLGSTTVTLIATDTSGNTSSTSVVVVVNDNEAPTISCVSNFTQSNDPDTCGAVVNFTITGSDNCAYTITNDFNAQSSNNAALAFTDFLPQGNTTITFTITDTAGNNANCAVTVTIADTQAPNLICPPDIYQSTLDQTVCYDIVSWSQPNTSDGTLTDNCPGLLTISQTTSYNNPDLYAVGHYTVEYLATDASGNTATCSFGIEVIDSAQPVINNCPGDITLAYDPNTCGAVATWSAPSATDNCPGVLLTADYAPGSVFPLGTTTVTYTALDTSSNFSYCNFTVTVTDNTVPTVTCIGDTTIYSSDTMCGDYFSYVITTNDDCDTIEISYVTTDQAQISSPGARHSIGMPPLAFDRNVAGTDNYNSAYDDVYEVHDNIYFDTDSNTVIIRSPKKNFSYIFVDGRHVAQPLTLEATGLGSYPNASNSVLLNVYYRTDLDSVPERFKINGEGGFDLDTTDVLVRDNGPTVQFYGKKSIWVDAATFNAWKADNTIQIDLDTLAPNAVDWYLSGSGSSGERFLNDAYFEIVYTRSAQPELTVVGDVKYILHRRGDINSASEQLDVYGENGFYLGLTSDAAPQCGLNFYTDTFTISLDSFNAWYADGFIGINLIPNAGSIGDFCDYPGEAGSNYFHEFIIPQYMLDTQRTGLASGSFFETGSHLITYTVTDSSGNSSSCQFTVTVLDTIKPMITCPTPMASYNNDPGQCSASISLALPVVSDNCMVDTFYHDSPYGVSPQDASGVYPVAGPSAPYTVTYTVVDTSGNTNTCSFTFTVVDNENPVISCIPDISAVTAAGVCGNTITGLTLPVATDNCSIASIVNDYTGTNDASGFYPAGVTTVIFTVTDIWGNVSTCSFTVTITDNEPPTLTCAPDVVQDNDQDSCGAFVSVLTTVFENCVIDTTYYTASGALTGSWTGLDASGDYPVGTTTIVFFASDTAGNSSTCSTTVTIADTQRPEITCPADVVVNNDPGVCEANVTIPLPTVWDNCMVASYTNDYNGTSDASDTYPVGVTTVTYTVTDIYGYTNSCSFTVTVIDNEAPNITCPSDIYTVTDPGVCEANITIALPITTDNCVVDTFWHDSPYGITPQDASGVYPKDTIVITYIVVDSAGNSNSCSFTVGVRDAEPPVITCTDQQFFNDPGKCYSTQIYAEPTVTDNCPGPWITHVSGPMQGDTLAVGTHVVTYMATDMDGNTSTCSFTITVIDNEPPQTNCPADIVVSNDQGVCGAQVNYILQSPSDNCLVASVVQTDGSGYTSGDVFPVGTTVQSYLITDQYGNTNSCSFTVTVNDDEAPVITNCPADIVQGSDPGQCGAVVTWTVPDTSDNCGIVVYMASHNPGDYFPVGNTTVSYYVEDAAGNSAMCVFVVTVNDTENPDLACPADMTVSNDAGDCSAVVNYSVPLGTDNCSFTEYFFDFETGGQGWKTGVLPGSTVDYWNVYNTVASSGNNSYGTSNDGSLGLEHSYIVSPALYLSDNTPTLTFDSYINNENSPSDLEYVEVSIDGGVTWTEVDATLTGQLQNASSTSVWNTYSVSFNAAPAGQATFLRFRYNTVNTVGAAPNAAPIGWYVDNVRISNDNYTATLVSGLPSGATFPVGTTTNVYSVTDDAGNTASCSFDVTVNDTEAPVANCPADINVNNDAGQCGAVVNWNFSATDNCGVSSISSTHASGDFFPVGTTTVTYTVTDIYGNVSTCSFDVTVNDTEAPVANCPADITLSNDPGQCGAVATWMFSSSDNCAVATVSSTHSSGDFFPVGTTTVTYTVTDVNGNITTCSFTVTVNDTEAPVPACPANISVSNDAGQCGAVVTWSFSATDNCSVASISSTHASGDFFAVGTTTVTYTVTDIYGNVATCSFDVTVNDTEAPVANCPADITLSNDPGQCGAVASWIFSSSDNCGVASVSSTHASGDFFAVGTTTVTYTVTDVNGNVTTCSFTVTVNDTEDPVITSCPSTITVTNGAGLCGAVVIYSEPSFTDNCGATLALIQGLPNGSEFPVGTTTQVYEITDAAGNAVTCSFDVVVTDDEVPTITCPADIVVSTDPGVCEADVTVPLPVVGDNCEVLTFNTPFPTPTGDATVTTYVRGDYSFSLEYTDFYGEGGSYIGRNDGGNFFDCFTTPYAAAFTVSQSTLSSWISDNVIQIDAQNSVYVNSFCSNEDIYVEISYPTSTGTFTVTSNVQEITTTAQSFTFLIGNGPATSNLLVVNDYTGSDDASATYPEGTTTVTYTVTDPSGNESTCSFTVTVNDNEAPVITCPQGDTTIYADAANCSAPYTFGMATATDNCGIDTITQIAGLASGSDFPVGTTTITFNALDVNGNNTKCSFTVTVLDTIAPVLACTDTIFAPTDSGLCEAFVQVANPGVTEACSYTIVNDYNNSSDASDVYPVGATDVTFTVTDASGNVSTCLVTIMVIDMEAPVITCPADIVVNNDTALCGAIIQYSLPTATDNCPGVSVNLISGLNSLSLFPVGTTTVVYQATDAEGNTSTCSFDVTVIDVEGPTWVNCPGDITVSNDSGQCAAVVSWLPPFAFDNCGASSDTSNFNPGDLFPVGTTTVIYTATDTSGNVSECVFTVTVLDNEAPVITDCPADIVTCDPLVTWSEPSASDNCAVVSFTSSHTSGSQFPIGTTVVTYTAVDAAGNQTVCSFNVTVNPLPIADAGADRDLCIGSTTTLGGNPTGSGTTGNYTYSWSPAASLSDAAAANPDASPSVTTTYTVVVTDANGCSSEDMVTVTVLPLPTVDAGANTAICFGESTTIGGNPTASGTTGNYTYSWAPATGLSSTTVANPVASPTTTTTYTVTVSDGNACVATATIEVTVNPLPDASITAVDPLCVNAGNQTLTAATAGGTWSGPGIVNAAAGTFNPAAAGVGTHVITYEVIDANGCYNSATTSIEVQPTPNITVFSAGPFCENDDPTFLTATPFFNIHNWFGPGIVNGTTGEFNPSVAGAGQHEIFYTVTGENGCADTASTIITVYAAPAITITAAGPFCENEPVQVLTANISGGNWSGPGIIQSQLGEFLPIAAGAGVHEISYTVTNSNQCTATETTIIVVNEVPAITGSVTEATCETSSDGAINITIDGGVSPYSYTWSNGATTEDLSNLAAGVYDVTVTDQNGCNSTASFTVGVSTQPVNATAIITPATTPTTADGSIDVTVTGGVAPYTYSWSNGATSEDISGLYTGTYVLSVVDAAGCNYLFSFFVPARYSTGITVQDLDEGINLFPNPTNNTINVEIEIGKEADMDMTVFDMLGRKMYEVHTTISGKYTEQIHMSDWASGQYMIRFNIDGQSVTKKYILAK